MSCFKDNVSYKVMALRSDYNIVDVAQIGYLPVSVFHGGPFDSLENPIYFDLYRAIVNSNPYSGMVCGSFLLSDSRLSINITLESGQIFNLIINDEYDIPENGGSYLKVGSNIINLDDPSYWLSLQAHNQSLFLCFSKTSMANNNPSLNNPASMGLVPMGSFVPINYGYYPTYMGNGVPATYTPYGNPLVYPAEPPNVPMNYVSASYTATAAAEPMTVSPKVSIKSVSTELEPLVPSSEIKLKDYLAQYKEQSKSLNSLLEGDLSSINENLDPKGLTKKQKKEIPNYGARYTDLHEKCVSLRKCISQAITKYSKLLKETLDSVLLLELEKDIETVHSDIASLSTDIVVLNRDLDSKRQEWSKLTLSKKPSEKKPKKVVSSKPKGVETSPAMSPPKSVDLPVEGPALPERVDLSFRDSLALSYPDVIPYIGNRVPPYMIQTRKAKGGKTVTRLHVAGSAQPLPLSKIDEIALTRLSMLVGKLSTLFKFLTGQDVPIFGSELDDGGGFCNDMYSFSYELVNLSSSYVPDKKSLDTLNKKVNLFMVDLTQSLEKDGFPIFLDVCAAFLKYKGPDDFDIAYQNKVKMYFELCLFFVKLHKSMGGGNALIKDPFFRNENLYFFLLTVAQSLIDIPENKLARTLFESIKSLIVPYWLILGLKLRINASLMNTNKVIAHLGDEVAFTPWKINLETLSIRKNESEDECSIDDCIAAYLGETITHLIELRRSSKPDAHLNIKSIDLKFFYKFFLLMDFINSVSDRFEEDVSVAFTHIQLQRHEINDFLYGLISMEGNEHDEGAESEQKTYSTSPKLMSIFPKSAEALQKLVKEIVYVCKGERLDTP